MDCALKVSPRHGITIVELLVALAIIGMLCALVVPAVLAARETSRRAGCTSRLRQIGVGISQYESAYGMLPSGGTRYGSFLVAILPFIEHSHLYARVNFAAEGHDEAVKELLAVTVPDYLCPSDAAGPVTEDIASTNYAGNAGTGVQAYGYNGVFQHLDAVYPHLYPEGPVRLANTRDGLSSTVAVAEVLHADGTFSDRRRVIWETPKQLDLPHQLPQFAQRCNGMPPQPRAFGWRGNRWSRGTPWVTGDFGFSLYNHVLLPNRPSCTNAGDWQRGAYSASSAHASGVNVLFADGRAEFVAESIDAAVWAQLGSRVERVLARSP